MRTAVFAFLVGMLCALAVDGRAIAATSCQTGSGLAMPSAATAARFERLYEAWHREAQAIQFSSNTRDYVGLPSYRRIVGLGRAALRPLAKKLSQARGTDFMLADAVAEICGWDPRDLASDSAQAFSNNVLRRLRGSEAPEVIQEFHVGDQQKSSRTTNILARHCWCAS